MTHWIAVRLLCRSTARLESDTLTTVASSCARNEPSTATEVTFQTDGSSRQVSLGTLGKGGKDLVGCTDAGETWEGFFEGEAVLFGVLAGAGIFDKHKGKAEAGTLACGGLDT